LHPKLTPMKVLIAEDDRLFQLILERSLSKWGYEVVTVSDGEEALRELLSKGGPQFAILDWMMPKFDGLEVCRQVREAKLPGYVYIILLTAKQESNLVAGFEAGVDDYLFKPVNLDELRLRLRAGRRVLEAGQWYRSIAETASDGIVILQDQTIVFANSSAEEIFGFTGDEMLGRDFSSLAAGVNLQECAYAESGGEQHGRSSPVPIEVSTKHRNGRDIVLEISISEFAPFDQRNHLTVVIRDVTQRNTMEKQRAQNYKMESIGQLAAGVAHEINTPIQYIGDNMAFLQESYQNLELLLTAYHDLFEEMRPVHPSPSRIERVTKLIEAVNYRYLQQEVPRAFEQSLEGVDQVAGIVAAMKDFSHPGSSGMAPADLNQLIDSAVVISKNQWKYIADLRMHLDRDLPAVVCSSGELRQVLLNLLVNAVDAIADAAKVNPERKGLIQIGSRRDGDMAEIRISDSGMGIPENIRAKVFDLFFTTKEVGKGSGQGLALAYSTIVNRHEGSIEFESEPGAGTTFILRLPIAGAAAVKPQALGVESYDAVSA
jgi:two-component system, NtrC family, sensor kinase